MPSTHLPGLAVIGGGPAGLMAAETARAAGVEVDLFDAKGSVGRKVLIAGKGGLNLTHGEAFSQFCRRFGERSGEVTRWLQAFGPEQLREWAAGLGVDTFVGSSGRVFPSDLKAAPLLRGWVRRLREQGVRFHVQHRWLGLDADGAHRFQTPEGERRYQAGATVLAMGGGSGPQLGSDGAWTPLLADSGFEVDARGRALTDATLRVRSRDEAPVWVAGDCAAPRGVAGSELVMGCKTALPVGAHAADNVLRWLSGRPELSFRWRDVGYCLSLGRQDAVISPLGADGAPTSWSLRGALGAFVKERVNRYTIRSLHWERRSLLSYRWPKPRSARVQLPARLEDSHR